MSSIREICNGGFSKWILATSPHGHATLYAWFLKDRSPPSAPTPLDHHHTLYHLTLRSAKGNWIWLDLTLQPRLSPSCLGLTSFSWQHWFPSKCCEFIMTLLTPDLCFPIFLLVEQISSFLLPFQRNPPWLPTSVKTNPPFVLSKHQADSIDSSVYLFNGVTFKGMGARAQLNSANLLLAVWSWGRFLCLCFSPL